MYEPEVNSIFFKWPSISSEREGDKWVTFEVALMFAL